MLMKAEKISYVCTVCSTTFTRRSSGKRHNVGTHSGTAPFVRLIDYIIGRIEGRYQPSDPLLYRHKKNDKKNVKNSLFLESCKNGNLANKVPTSGFTVIPDETIKNPYYEIDTTTVHLKSDLNRETTGTIPRDSGEPGLNVALRGSEGLDEIGGTKQYEKNASSTVSNSEFQEWASKFRELTTLIKKNYSKENAEVILNCVKFYYLEGKDDVIGLDDKLVFLRSLDKNMSGFS
jgi:hypothetical protein